MRLQCAWINEKTCIEFMHLHLGFSCRPLVDPSMCRTKAKVIMCISKVLVQLTTDEQKCMRISRDAKHNMCENLKVVRKDFETYLLGSN